MHHINIHNKSDHEQTFECHGFNDGKNINVKPHTTTALPAADGQSGAIIALHDGHEGEQAEITKAGFGGKLPPPPSPGGSIKLTPTNQTQATTSST